MKKLIPQLLFFIILNSSAQRSKTEYVGLVSKKDFAIETYSKDSSAVAIVLYELGNYYADMNKKFTQITDYYYRIKILKPEGLDKGTIKIPFFKEEKVSNIRGLSANLNPDGIIEEKKISEDDIIKNETKDEVQEVIINIPNTMVGSVIEYSYRITSPYLFIKDWNFQTDIPKIRSEFTYFIPSNREYITRLRGKDTLSLNDSIKISKCLKGKTYGKNCKSYLYRMDSISAFKEEILMPEKDNLTSSLTFKLSYVLSNSSPFPLYRTMSNWREFDNRYQYILDKDKKADSRFYKRQLPDSIFKIKNNLLKAKQVYYFIQNHYTWNEYLGGSISYKLRKKFKSKKGSVNLINSSLLNSLNAVGIECYYVLLSTRGNGIPEKQLPILEDFNYLIVKAIIDGKEYFLDATEKELRFGVVPTRVLNDKARVMDFDNGSYWQKIKPLDLSSKISILDLSFDDEMDLKGKLFIKRSGIEAYQTRKKFKILEKEKYIETVEEEIPSVLIDKYLIKNTSNKEERLIEEIDISIETEDINTELISDKIICFSPVFFDQLSINPFKSNERLHDLDFVFPIKNTYRASFKIPEGYQVTKLPKDFGLKLPNNGGSYIYKIGQKDNEIKLYIKFYLAKELFSSEEYYYLKKLYEEIIDAEQSTIEITKIKK